MQKNILSIIAAAAAVCAIAHSTHAEINLEYYSSLQGLSGATLKTAIHELVGDPSLKMLSYGSGNNKTWWGFYVTDRTENNEVIDRYSPKVFTFGERGASVSGMNIEHSFPKSWWGGAQNNAYKDLYNLMPCEQSINSSKSNYPIGKVKAVTATNGVTKIGPSAAGYKVWEPADQWKGDFARGYFYMATAYQNLTWSGSGATDILENNTYPTLQEWAYSLLLEWSREDGVSAIEYVRNQNVNSLQGNRNPFVDFPNLMEYVWGDSIGIPLDLRTTLKAEKAVGNVGDISGAIEVVFSNSLLGDRAGCQIEHTVKPSAVSSVWNNNATYGWVAKASTGTTGNIRNYQSDATLVTPEIDLSKYASAWVSFDHAVNWCTTVAPSSLLSVSVRTADGTETQLDIPVWPAGNKWTYSSVGDCPLTRFAGKKIRLAFRYTSDTSVAPTWEIKNLKVTAQGRNSGIDRIPDDSRLTDDDNSLLPVEFFSVDGIKVDPASYHGIVIRRQGSKVSKLILR